LGPRGSRHPPLKIAAEPHYSIDQATIVKRKAPVKKLVMRPTKALSDFIFNSSQLRQPPPLSLICG
jgi:hypothetical protein